MPASRLCEHCHAKHAQHTTRPYCLRCARLLGLSAPYRYRRSPEVVAPPLGPKPLHRVQSVEQFRVIAVPLPPAPEPEQQFRTIGGIEYEIIWSGRGSLPGFRA